MHLRIDESQFIWLHYFSFMVHKIVVCLRFNEVQYLIFRIMWQRLLPATCVLFPHSNKFLFQLGKWLPSQRLYSQFSLQPGVAICLSSGQWFVSRSNMCNFWFVLLKKHVFPSLSSFLPSFFPPYFFPSFLPPLLHSLLSKLKM